MATLGEKIDAGVDAATKRIRGFTGLIVALLCLAGAAVALCSFFVAIGQHKLALQVPLGPRLGLSSLLSGTSETVGEVRVPARASASLTSQMEQVGVLGGMCIIGEVGTVVVRSPKLGRRRSTKARRHRPATLPYAAP